MDSGIELIAELNEIAKIYTKELREWRKGNGKGKFLLEDDMFNVFIKLLDKSDKIKKLNTEPEAETEKEEPKIRNLQDFVLKSK